MTTTKVELVGGPWDGMRTDHATEDEAIRTWCGGVGGIPLRTAHYRRATGITESGHRIYEFIGYEQIPGSPR